MIKDLLENAALDFAKIRYGNSGNETASEMAKVQSCYVGFKQGVRWCLNSIQHDMKDETPQAIGKYENQEYPQIPCIVEGKLSTGYGVGIRYWNVTEQCWDSEDGDDYECGRDAIDTWIYLDDVLLGI